jgi:hypothetical protein
MTELRAAGIDGYIGSILCGYLAGTGASLLLAFLSRAVPHETTFTPSPWALQASFWSALALRLNAVHLYIPMEHAKLFVMLFLSTHTILEFFAGPTVPVPFNLLNSLFFFLTRIPPFVHPPASSVAKAISQKDTSVVPKKNAAQKPKSL